MRSIRVYLLQRLLGGAALVLAGAGVVLYLIVARSLEAQFDRNLADRVQGLASILFQQEDEVDFQFSEQLMPEYDVGERPDYFELWFEDGELLERSPALEHPEPRDLEVVGEVTEAPTLWTAPLPDGRPGRYIAQTLEVHHVWPEEGPDRPVARRILVVVARGRDSLIAAERMTMGNCAIGFLALLALLGFLAWHAVRRGLEPALRLATEVGAIQPDRLPETLDVGELPAELQPVADKTDLLIRRVDAALKRERRTTADIAHELRTPISELLTAAEVALRNGQDPEQNLQVLGTVRDVAWRMGRSVSTLLKLARLEMGAENFDVEEVPIADVVDEARRSMASLARGRDVELRCRITPGTSIQADPEVVRIIATNLLSNALYYSAAPGVVQCSFAGEGSRWTLTVQNQAEGLREEDVSSLTQPFWRKDHARTDRNRSGLGLALSHALAERTGLDLRFELIDGCFRACLSGPRTHPPRHDPAAPVP